MNTVSVICVLLIAIIAKGQPQKQHVQQQQIYNQLTIPHRATPSGQTTKLEIVQERIESVRPVSDPIRFPVVGDDDRERLQLQQQLLQQQQQHQLHLQQQQKHPQPPQPLPSLPPPPNTIEAIRNQGHTNAPVRVASLASNRDNTADQFDYVRDFSWRLFQGSKLASSIGNLIISPIQPQLLLSLLRTASSGSTERQIAETIGEIDARTITGLVTLLKHDTNNYSELAIANAIFADQSFELNGTFISEALLRGVSIMPVNFNSVETSNYVINNWIANATKNQISSIYKANPDRAVKLLLANTIYFRGEWKYGFTETAIERFETTETLSKPITMMKSKVQLRTGTLKLANDQTGHWIEMPYLNSNFSMIVILPEKRHKLDALVAAMHVNDFTAIFHQLKHSYKKIVDLTLPKFTAQSTYSMVNVLQKMGIIDLFTTNSRLPYFARSQTDSSLRVDDILQHSILSVDEKGTVAASATISHVVTLSLSSVPEQIFFKVDSPFLAVIVDKRNQVPLFISKIYDP